MKIMISGLMDFDRFGVLTEEGLPPQELGELIHIAHEEGFSVMAHANGARTVEAAAEAGVVPAAMPEATVLVNSGTRTATPKGADKSRNRP